MCTATSAGVPVRPHAPGPPARASAAGGGEDERWRQVEVRIRRLGARPDGLIEVLHTVQELFGYVSAQALSRIGDALRVPPSQVLGVATFYSYFLLEPPGEHTCVVCIGTACYLNGAKAILSAIEERAGVVPGERTADGKLTLLGARCLAACSTAPVLVLDGSAHGRITPAETTSLLGAL